MSRVIACRAIFFDAGNTLFHPYPSVGAIYARVASRHGVDLAPDQLESRFHRQWQTTGGLASLKGPATPDLERRWWRSLVKNVFAEILEGEAFEKFFDELYRTFGQAGCWRVYPEVQSALEKLKGKGFRLGIISNWDSRLLGLCRDMGLEHFFDFILISAVIGHSKPGSKIFHEAVRLSQTQRQQALHVGDSFEDDFLAARNAGLGAIFLDRSGKAAQERREEIPRVADLEELTQCVRLV